LENAVQNLLQIWQGLDARKRMIVLGATAAMFMAIFALSQMTGRPGMSLLYAGLNAAAAGDVIAALDQRGATYEVRGDSIYVDDAQRDSLRMTLAAEGLPANGGTGYELLDSLSGFGTTSQMFDAAYWRAKEGELARTILANPQIRAARVHIAQAPSQPFQRDVKPQASVTISSVGGGLPPAQAKALRHLIAASVPGMTPGEVAVIDSVSGLIASDTDQSRPDAAAETRAQEIRSNVERLLAARVGPGKAVVEVSVDVITESEAITERSFDPQGRVAISTDSNSRTGSSTQPQGDVTVASNLPAGDAAGGAAGKNENSETREQVNYEVSETKREIVKVPGSVRKISVAVLVDGQEVTAADGSVSTQPRPDDELAVLRELVASAVGLDETRGDVLTLRSLTFQPVPIAGTLAEAGMFSGLAKLDPMTLIQTAVLALVTLILGLFVVRPMVMSPGRRAALPAPGATLALPGFNISDGSQRVLTGEIDEGDLPPLSLVNETDGAVDPITRLRRLIEERQAESVEILRGWMEYEEEKS
jgi:flagellar M-ring protein FliF